MQLSNMISSIQYYTRPLDAYTVYSQYLAIATCQGEKLQHQASSDLLPSSFVVAYSYQASLTKTQNNKLLHEYVAT